MGRWKGSPQGPYYDPNDTGPDQVAPPPGMGQNGQPLPQQAQQPDPSQIPWPGPHQGPWMPPVIDSPPGYDPNHPAHEVGGIDPNAPPGTYKPWSESVPDGNGGYYNPGGHVDANGNPLPGPPPLDTSGWARKQYPGGVGGPLTPMNGSLGSLSGMTKTADPSMTLGGWGKPSGGQTGTLSSLMNGGNLAGTGSAFGALFGKR